MKSRAEDGRSIENDNIEAFIRDLPGDKSTRAFSSEDASGSTSQAAGVSEALEADAKVLLFDEDTSAANFMVRDALMQKVVHPDHEPITPLVYRISQLFERAGVSTILVAGSSGAFFEQADLVLQMDHYIPMDVTARAKEMALAFPYLCSPERKLAPERFFTSRVPLPLASLRSDRVKIKSQGLDAIVLDREPLDVRLVEQLVDPEQLPTLGAMVLYAHRHLIDGKRTLKEVADRLEERIDSEGLRVLGKRDFCRVRKQEFMGGYEPVSFPAYETEILKGRVPFFFWRLDGKWTFITESIPVRVLICAECPILYPKRYKMAIFVEYIPERV